MSDTGLPLQLAIRTVLDDVSYSNPLPDWYTPEEIDYAAREKRLRQRAASYLKGGEPLAALRVQVPSRAGDLRTWMVPAVNDQMILQACVAAFSAAVAKRFNARQVFSCQPNDDPTSTALMANQINAWMAFQKETVKRVRTHRYILQFDIQRAFASIDQADFLAFLRTLNPKGPAVDLLQILLSSWSGSDRGVPLINDSLFFVGSSYLNRVDAVVARYRRNFIRYMDDYRVFGDSKPELEGVFERISHDLAGMGFRLNPWKVKLGSQKDYLEALSQPRFESLRPPALTSLSYIKPVDTDISTQLGPPQVEELVVQALERPNDYLNEGIGRYLLGTLRRYRLNAAANHRANAKGEQSTPGFRLRKLLGSDANVLKLTGSRLSEYSVQPEQSWRLVWLIYLIEQAEAESRMRSPLARLEGDKKMPQVVQLWARRCLQRRNGEPLSLREDLHDLSYLEAGLRCYGEKPCIGEGF